MARIGDFSMAGRGVIGFFIGDTLPTSDGTYFYEPYRSYGHYHFRQALAASTTPRCFYESEGQRVWFTVLSAPAHKQLSLSHFDFE